MEGFFCLPPKGVQPSQPATASSITRLLMGCPYHVEVSKSNLVDGAVGFLETVQFPKAQLGSIRF